jgi:hypothetical protein
VGAAGTFLGLGGGSDSDDDGAAAANKSNPSYYSGACSHLFSFGILSNSWNPPPPSLFFSLFFLSGAGLLLWDAHSKTVILGKDFNQEWSDFGGKRDQTDHDAWFTASREAAEESLGVLNGSIVNKQRVIAEVRFTIVSVLVVVAIVQMLISRRIAATKFKRLQVRAGTYVCYLIDTTGTKICK